MQDRPNARELLATVSAFLEDELMPELDGPLRYRTRVALNLTRILEREQRLAPSHLRQERDRLCRLLGQNPESLRPASLTEQVEELNAALVARLEAERVDTDFAEQSWAVVMETVREKLAVVRPGYDDYDAREELS